MDSFADLASVVECDVTTICDDITEDIDKWIQEVSENEDPVTPTTNSGVYPDYVTI